MRVYLSDLLVNGHARLSFVRVQPFAMDRYQQKRGEKKDEVQILFYFSPCVSVDHVRSAC